MATIIDVAREADVSPATVSRVINNSFLVSDEKKQRVYEAMQKVGYVISTKSRSARNSNGKLLMAVTNMTQYDLFDGMQRTAAELGYGLAFAHTSDRPDALSETVDLLKLIETGGQLAGIFLINYIEKKNQDFLGYIKRFPVVQVCESAELEENFLVASDDYQAAYDAVTHLIEQGKRRIAIYATRKTEYRMNFESQRIRGYRAALMDNGIMPEEELFRYSDFTLEGAVYATNKMLGSLTALPDAIFCLNDLVAIGCMKTLLEKEIRVPEQIAVVGVDDLPESMYYHPSLSSVAQNFDAIGSEAVRLMHTILSSETNGGRKIYVPHKLMVRGSSTVVSE